MQTLPQTNIAPSVGMKRLEQHCREQRGKSLRLAMRWLHDWQLAEDVLQEASLRAYDAIERGMYDVARPFAPWFRRIVRRLSYNKLTRQVRPDRERLLSLIAVHQRTGGTMRQPHHKRRYGRHYRADGRFAGEGRTTVYMALPVGERTVASHAGLCGGTSFLRTGARTGLYARRLARTG